MRKAVVVVICCAAAFLWLTTLNIHIDQSAPTPVRVKVIVRPSIGPALLADVGHASSLMLDVPYPSVLTERQTSTDPACTDRSLTVSPDSSTVTLLGDTATYRVGDIIRVHVVLRDHHGHVRSRGGEIVKVLLASPGQRSFVPGRVYDNGNGTYLAEVEALWSGRVQLIVRLHVAREEIAATYRVRRQMIATRYLQARFQHENTSEVSFCHPNSKHLQRFVNTSLCNFTHLNSDEHWFCGAPANLSCEDWVESREQSAKQSSIPLTDLEMDIIKTPRLLYNVTLLIEHSKAPPLHTANRSCNTVPRQSLWQQRDPTGFFHRDRWLIRNCQNGSPAALVERLRNKTVYLLGDSTLRQWLEYAESNLKCKMITRIWTNNKWNQRCACSAKELNLTVGWYTGNYPYYVSPTWQDKNRKFLSAARVIDSIHKEEDCILVVHLFMHMTTMLPGVFTMKMKSIKESIVRLLHRNKRVQIFIKAPHSCRGHEVVTCVFAYEYINILHTMFQDVREHVIYLDNMDATDAIENASIHPPVHIVEAMFYQMLNYARN